MIHRGQHEGLGLRIPGIYLIDENAGGRGPTVLDSARSWVRCCAERIVGALLGW